ncbi:UNVERIFIED_CONTAM: hypothetical protein Slati_1140400 [Sesamum latifolium]|uniref:Transposase n=1 Tax=Sesamum latifolium TaxID=2727402 RepID=A0AAW2XD69_9LAMI
MVIDATGPIFPPVHVSHQPNENETGISSNDRGESFLDGISAADQPLYSGSKNHSQLSAVARLVNIKSEYNLPQSCYDEISQLIGFLPQDHTLPKDYYSTKKLIRELGLLVQKIDACKRLYASNTIAEHMSWHATHETENGIMCHPSDAEAWKHFKETYPDFDLEPHNVRLGLCADGFAPHGQYEKSYSCWPVIITPYNLPPGMCMKSEYMFLSLIIPGPANPKRLIDVYLQPLIEELVQLWQVGAQTYDASGKEFFMMRATLMWTVNDFPAYGMLSSWSTAGIMGCPICMDNTRAFHLQHGRKACYFDCHR